jgi:hypothetical protein
VLASNRTWSLVTIKSSSAGELSIVERPCMIKVKTDRPSIVSIRVPQASVDRMHPVERAVHIGSSDPGSAFVSKVATTVQGANLCEPVHDPLPSGDFAADDATSCDMACTGSQCDQDLDGHPGMTTSIKSSVANCDVYGAIRTSSRLDGKIESNDRIAGTLRDRSHEQSLLAATNDLCLTNGKAQDDDCDEHHLFRMIRVTDDAECADVLALTDCDEDETKCESNKEQPLDPPSDVLEECK